MLNDSGKLPDYSVFNAAECEMNSQELLDRLPSIITEYSPDIMVILVGSANKFNPWNFNKYDKMGFIFPLKKWVLDLRTYKMMRLIMLNLKAKRAALETPKTTDGTIGKRRTSVTKYDIFKRYLAENKKIESPDPDNLHRTLWYKYNQVSLSAAINHATKALSSDNDYSSDISAALIYFLFRAGDTVPVDTLIEYARDKYPEDPLIESAIACYYRELAEIYRNSREFERSIDIYLKAISTDSKDYYNYYWIAKLLPLQSKYDSIIVYEFLKKMAQNNPELLSLDVFSNNLRLFKSKQEWDREIEQWLNKNLSDIIHLCKKNNISIVLQEYPVNYLSANSIIKAAAYNHSLPLVKNLTLFAVMPDKNKYILDDDHCTAAGHELMAKNVYNKLIEEKLINKR